MAKLSAKNECVDIEVDHVLMSDCSDDIDLFPKGLKKEIRNKNESVDKGGIGSEFVRQGGYYEEP